MTFKKETDSVRYGDLSNHNHHIKNNDVVTPIHITTTFHWDQIDKPGQYEYIRSDNPTRNILEQQLAVLENARYGLVFSSGMAAETTILLGLLKSNDHIICFDDLYGGTKRLINSVFSNFGITADYINVNDENELLSHIKPNTRLIWLESPTNPLMKIADIETISKTAKKYGILVVVDNTFLTPYLQNPLDFGADIVVHSGTKYLGGHSDVLSGAIMLNDEIIYDKLYLIQNSTGNCLPPFDCFLVLRGLKTLHVRMAAHEQNAFILAQYLEKHPKVKRVLYPGLTSFPQYELNKKQSRGYGGMISFELHGNLEYVKSFLGSLKLFVLAESLGGVESLIEHPATMTHSSMTPEEQRHAGITDSLIRVSVGIEHVMDLMDDLEQAFNCI